MKKVIRLIGVFGLTAFLAFSTPTVVVAQDRDTTADTRTDDADDDDDGKWGLLGLLGLAGLLGLKRRDDDRNRPTATPR